MDVLLDSAWLNFGQHEILRGAHLRLRKGEVTGLLGRNGSGKSCMLKILIGQLRPANGYIGLNGQHIRDLYAKPGLINYLSQHVCHPLDLRLNALLRCYGVEPADFWLMHQATLDVDGEVRLGNLSGGTQRLFEVLLVLAADTHFTLLDEPFSHVAPLHIDYLCDYIRKRSELKGILVTDHKYEQVLELAQVIYLVYDGTSRIVSGKEDLARYGYLR